METPIFDFVEKYLKSDAARLHMPGHKGKNILGCEERDITEINGADSLYEANGIIAESERNASGLFGTKSTFYSAEGSSLCIRAMLYLALSVAKEQKKVIFAGRNAHKVFMYSSALLDFDTVWLYGKTQSLCECKITPEDLEKAFGENRVKPCAVYITSPDYLGNVADIRGLSRVCHRHGVPLIVDNAHGAYLKFLPTSLHPVDLGADMCCDSAHKTLPVLTGGAYLHISKNSPEGLSENARNAMALFGSTSPSYLILQSLDLANKYLSDSFKKELFDCCERVEGLKRTLSQKGFELVGNESIKLTIRTKSYGYNARQVAKHLEKHGVVREFCDDDCLVLMFSVCNTQRDFDITEKALLCLEPKKEITSEIPRLALPEKAMSPRQAMQSQRESLDVGDCEGRILASSNVACPPAIPIVVCGEIIDKSAVDCFRYYGIKKAEVVKS